MSLDELRCWAEICPDELAHNVAVIRRQLNKETKLLGVVKADAYGHGATEIAKKLQQLGADYLATACFSEACELRERGITLPILMLSHTLPQQAKEMAAKNCIPSVFDWSFAEELNREAAGTKLKVHLKIDTGMTRLGFHYCNDNSASDRQTVEEICRIARLPNLEIEGIYSHFASADEADGEEYTQMQFDRFCALLKKLEECDIHIPIRHISNSAATLLHPEMQLDMVRCGIILYGVYPSQWVKEQCAGKEKLKPLMSFRARVTQVRTVPTDVSISYGRRCTTCKETRLAVVSAGYADGYRRLLGKGFEVLIHGKAAPICGTVCMDQFVVDITDIPETKAMDIVTLFGKDGDKELPVTLMADALDTISYEIFCLLSKRVHRVYNY